MKLLFLFFTQSESGAPGYLSRKGEEAAAALGESLGTFLSESLGLGLSEGFDARARSLQEDIRWKAFRSPDSQAGAVAASRRLFPDVVLVSGMKERSLNTTEAVASRLALPVIVDARLDCPPGEKNAPGDLSAGLASLLASAGAPPEPCPKVVLVGTSLEALLCWLEGKMPEDQRASAKEALEKATEGGLFPTVFACGFERSEGTDGAQGTPADLWLFD